MRPFYIGCGATIGGAAFFSFFLSSTCSIFSSGTSYFSVTHSSTSSLTSPCTVISSPPLAVLVTELPVANFLPNSFAAFFRSILKCSRPEISVTCLRLLRSTRLMMILEVARFSDSRASAASALAAFFWASFSARFCASTLREERFCDRASLE
jgi:hypothetical protein